MSAAGPGSFLPQASSWQFGEDIRAVFIFQASDLKDPALVACPRFLGREGSRVRRVPRTFTCNVVDGTRLACAVEDFCSDPQKML